MYSSPYQNRNGRDFQDTFGETQYKESRYGSGFGSSIYSGSAVSPPSARIQKDLYGNPSTQYKSQTDFQKKFGEGQEGPDDNGNVSESNNPSAAIRIRGSKNNSPVVPSKPENSKPSKNLGKQDFDDNEKIYNLQPNDQQYYFDNVYEPKDPDNFNMKELAKDPSVRLQKHKQGLYYGQYDDNDKRSGKGIFLHTDGRKYEGEWENDVKHGKGFEEFPNGSTYEGDFANGKPDGIGSYKYFNGETYEGDWLNGMKHGNGIWKGQENDSYVGEWKFGKPDGYGVHTWVNGDRYEGEFQQSLKHGEGTEKFANGDLYQGNYQSGKPDGYGEYYWANGSFFKGYFRNGMREGHGVWKRSVGDSDSYEGQYLGDKKSGQGVFTWASGNEYKGHYIDDIRHGYGEMSWADGSYYKGMWERGIQHGEGEMCMPGEAPKKGLFENNIFVGGNGDTSSGGNNQMALQNSIGPDSTSGRRRTNSNWGNPNTSQQSPMTPSYSRKASNNDLVLPDINQKSSRQPSSNNALQRKPSTSSNYFNQQSNQNLNNSFYDSPVKSPQKGRNQLDSSRNGPILPSTQNTSPQSAIKRQATYTGASKLTYSQKQNEAMNNTRNSNNLRQSSEFDDGDDLRRTLRANQKYNAAVGNQAAGSNKPVIGARFAPPIVKD